MDIAHLMQSQRHFFRKELPFSLDYRLSALQQLKKMIKENEEELLSALYHDLKKPRVEALITELLCIVNEINFIIKKLPKWLKVQKSKSLFPLNLLGRSYQYHEPYGVILIIAPWNYPLSLTLSPLMGAIAAGNCVIIKPSEIASHTEKTLHTLIAKYFSPDYVSVVTGDASTVHALIEQKPDYIFFTGSTQVGKKIMEKASQHLIPVTLELGGKSPVIIDETANIYFAARRVAWGKFINAGQTCIAPDYVYIHESCKDQFIRGLIKAFKQTISNEAAKSPDFGRIINQKHCEHLIQLLKKGGNIRFGGGFDLATNFVEPTIIDRVSFNDPIMQEEIFGPLLPIITFNNLDEVVNNLQKMPKPLALYYFTKSKPREERILKQLSFGGGCINDCITQISNWYLPFGGVGASGMGAYHGEHSFKTFSHTKAVYRRLSSFDYPLIYPPYAPNRIRWLKWLMGW